jgi:hypothetical protein
MNNPSPQDRVQVKILADGTILADDVQVSLEELGVHFAALKRNNGTVWYYRESARAEPHPNAMEAFKLIVDHKLPMTMSTKSDFTDAVGPDGVPHPR